MITPDQFKQIIVKRGSNGQIVYLADVADVELGAANYSTTSSLDDKPSIGLGMHQLPGSNALAASKAVRAKMKELSAFFPAGLEYRIVYEEGLEPKAATRKAMDEVGGPVVAIAVVLSAVFIPTAFVSGITGQFYRQFAPTIAVSTLISAFNSLTLSPALAALLLKSKGTKPDAFARLLALILGWFFRGFNSAFSATMTSYSRIVGKLLRLSAVVLLIYLGLLFLTGVGFNTVPRGFIPTQDQGYLVVLAQLPASLQRTEVVREQLSNRIRKIPGVAHTVDRFK